MDGVLSKYSNSIVAPSSTNNKHTLNSSLADVLYSGQSSIFLTLQTSFLTSHWNHFIHNAVTIARDNLRSTTRITLLLTAYNRSSPIPTTKHRTLSRLQRFRVDPGVLSLLRRWRPPRACGERDRVILAPAHKPYYCESEQGYRLSFDF